MTRVPLWLTLVPLLLGGAAYWHFWSGWRDTLRADVAAAVPGKTTIGGFPYRLEAEIAAPRYTLDGPLRLVLSATRALANRNPWQRDLTVVRAQSPTFSASVVPLTDVVIHGSAITAVSSIRLTPTGIARLSTVFTGLHAATGLFAAPIDAAHLEVHLRETRARSNEAWSATPPQQAQVVLSGTGVRFGQSAPLGFDLDAGLTATAPLHDYASWAAGGTVELRSAILADASGEVARLAASAVPDHGTLRLTGTITTVCPHAVAAAVAGTPPPGEARLRNAVRLSFGGRPGAFTLSAPPAGSPTAIRGQLPPCPRLD